MPRAGTWTARGTPTDASSRGWQQVRARAHRRRAPTPVQGHLLDNARRNTAVGEDIRVLPCSSANQLGLPHEDF
ncbi:DUF6879 family protein [Streptomyces sp. NPDC096142]|uniref:DUF6879 family protein n=1 Tax=Streptomyces sp. NPDC096142 TaxID=3366077 RepID=UPI0038235BFE